MFNIDGRLIGNGQPPFIVAELSANHNGSLQKALDTISAAKRSGADAIKLQTYTPDTMTIDCSLPDFMIKDGLWGGYKLYDLYKEAYTPFEWHKSLFEHARKEGISCFSTPFDETAVDLLEDLGAPAYKIASFELTDLPLVKYVASTGKPMIMSTGMADLAEISEAVEVARSNGCNDLIILHCISSYPAPVEQSNLLTLSDLRERLNVDVGLSDHTLTSTASLAAIALGACFIEKHFILDREDKGPDSSFSITPNDLHELCESALEVWRARGEVCYSRAPAESDNVIFRRSLYFVDDLKEGERLKPSHVRRIRPGFGIAPKYESSIIGKRLARDVSRGTAVSWSDFSD